MKKNVLKFPPLTADDIDSFPDFKVPGHFEEFDERNSEMQSQMQTSQAS